VQHPMWSEWYSRERHAERLRESREAAVVVEATAAGPSETRRPRRRSLVRVRLERPSDVLQLDRLARRAGRPGLRGVVVVAEDRGRLVVAVELHREAELIDPGFGRTEVVELVRLRAKQLSGRRAA